MPLFVCSATKLRSSSCSAWDNGINLPGSAAGAFGLSLIT
jgi:hypothetical protein